MCKCTKNDVIEIQSFDEIDNQNPHSLVQMGESLEVVISSIQIIHLDKKKVALCS